MIATAQRFFARETIFVPRYDPEDRQLSLERREDGQLWAGQAGQQKPVVVRRCFPWSDPMRYISLQDDDRNEFALVSHPAELDAASHDALVQALAEASFVLQVERILSIDEEIEIRQWKVQTSQGHRTLQTARDEWPLSVPGGGYLIRDVAGDLYHVADPVRLDERSRKLLWAFID